MRILWSRQRTELPGISGTVRVDRRIRPLLKRVRAGDLVVVDIVDIDRQLAEALVEARVSAVINAQPMVSGRFPNQGPQVLADAGITMVDSAGSTALTKVKDGAQVRLHEGQLLVKDDVPAQGREVSQAELTTELADARSGLTSQLASLTHNSTEFLRREQELLLHGEGVPTPQQQWEGRPVVIVADGPDAARQLRGIAKYIRERNPALVGVGKGARTVANAGHRLDVVILDRSIQASDLPDDSVLSAVEDLVFLAEPGNSDVARAQVAKLGTHSHVVETTARAEDIALLMADEEEAAVVIGVGMQARLTDFLDRQRESLASTYLTRLKVGPRLVDAEAVPSLHAGGGSGWAVFFVLLAGLLAIAAAILVTPVGQDWWAQLSDAVTDLLP